MKPKNYPADARVGRAKSILVLRWSLCKLLCSFALLVALGGGTLNAQTNVVPELSITPTATNDVVSVGVLNGDSQTSYQILRSYSPDLGTFTETAAIGTIGQTNFSLSMAADLYRFFRATPDLDWDDDGVENWKDAQPYTNSVGLLSVTIEVPANGAMVY